jgi:hypothetical protein
VEHFDTALPTTADNPVSDTKQDLPTGTSSATSTGKRLDGLLR